MNRLDKIVSLALNITRSEAKQMIKSGRISVGETVVRDSSVKTDVALIKADGKEIVYKEHIYIMMNKPVGVISASEDLRQKTVIDILPEKFKRKNLFPAGRLDKDTTGFMLITDDGDFAHSILSPKHHISKTYEVTLDAPVPENLVSEFKKGVRLYDGTLCIRAELILHGKDENTCTVILKEGKYHQIKRMFGVYDLGVTALHRKAMGKLELDKSLKPGECRELTDKEIEKICCS